MESKKHRSRKSNANERNNTQLARDIGAGEESREGASPKKGVKDKVTALKKDNDNEKIIKLQLENDILLLQLSKLNDSLNHWKLKCHRQENDDVNLSRLKLVTKENRALKEDLEVLKSVIKRLNQEISYYQEKIRSKNSVEPIAVPRFSSLSESGQADYEIIDPKKNLLPLLTAYDEVIEEKNEIIKDHELAIEKFKVQCRAVIQENEELHRIIGESKEKGSISVDDWKFLHDNAVTVLEENDILHDQIRILKSKTDILAQSYEEKVTKHKSKIAIMEDETTKLKRSIQDAQEKCAILTTQVSKMSQVIQHRIPVEEHEASIRECKRLFEELKSKYTEEKTELSEHIQALEKEKKRITDEMTDLDAENLKLRANTKSLEESLCINTAHLKNVQSEFHDAAKARQVTADTINEVLTLAKSAVGEKDTLEISFQEQRILNEKLMELRKQESKLVDELREKIKLMETAHEDDMEKYRCHISRLEEVLETIGERHQADIAHFKEVINGKIAHVEKLQIEKQQLIEDLETVWKARTRDASKGNSLSPVVRKYRNPVHGEERAE